MYKHTEVADGLGLTRQALDKYRKEIEATTATSFGEIVDGARVYTSNQLEQLREQLPPPRQRKLDEFIARQAPVNAELVDDPPGLLAMSNGFHSAGELQFSARSYSDMASHIAEEVLVSNQDTAQNVRNLFATLETADKELGAAIGAKRLQNVFGTADQVFNQGLQAYAKINGLGKPSESPSGPSS